MNKKVIFAPLFVIAAGVLAACSTSTIVARPNWDQKIIDNVDTKDNQMKVIYDAVKALGDTNANVLNKILFQIAEKNVGTYAELSKFGSIEETKPYTNDELKKFVQDHKIYQTTEKNLVYLDNQGKTVKENIENNEAKKLELSAKAIQEQFKELKENIAEKLYDDIKGGTYSIDNVFYEGKFLMSLRKNLYNVPHPDAVSTLYHGKVLLPRENDKDGNKVSWQEYILRYLNVDKEYTKELKVYDDYINNKIIPDIYRTYLIQTYVKEQRYPNIARSYARKVKMITIAQGSTQLKNPIYKLMTKFAKDNIIDNKTACDFTDLENAMRGFVGNGNGTTQTMLDSAGFTRIKDSSGADLVWHTMDAVSAEPKATYVYYGTKLGDLIEKLQKVYDLKNSDKEVTFTLRKDADTTAYNDLSGNGAHTIKEGLVLKEREIHLATYTKEGWFLKNGGLTDLNSTIRDRLFNIQTSSLVDTCAPGEYSKDKNPKGYKANDYIKNFNGSYFLTGPIYGTEGNEDLIVLKDGTNYHIIKVEEAISTSKMSDSTNDGSYMQLKANKGQNTSIEAMNKIVYDVVKTASAGDTYKKNANQYYLMISNILFYDQSVYDYFKSQYPDLFK